jgi:nicotinamide phosphoribosyltransferase
MNLNVHNSSLENNLLLLTDSYKLTHWKQYPPNIEKVYSYFESRGGIFSETLFFGLQYILKKYLEGAVITKDKINEADIIIEKHFENKNLFNRKGWEYILEHHAGKLPIIIKAVPEGTIVPTHNVLMTVENTDPKCYWLTNHIETLLVQVWYPTTVATLSFNMKKLIYDHLEKTGNVENIDFKLHDFGFRGVSSVESAGIGGAAHLVNFKSTDTIPGLLMLKKYYNADIAGFSIPASEHSTIISWGKNHEAEAMENMLNQFPIGSVAVVSDSYNIFNACENIWGDKLKDKILNRKGIVIIRPDSGTPEKIMLEVLDILKKKFGAEKNEKGYFVLPQQLRVIQGDGIDYVSANKILEAMTNAGWSTDNITLGMGGGLLQKLDRDTQKFAFKCSSVKISGQNIEVYKQPITDLEKSSKAGMLKLILRDNGKFETVKKEIAGEDQLIEVFRNGSIMKEYDLNEIRERANVYFLKNKKKDIIKFK